MCSFFDRYVNEKLISANNQNYGFGYIIKGYTLNDKRLEALQKTGEIQSKMISSILEIDGEDVLKAVTQYTKALSFLISTIISHWKSLMAKTLYIESRMQIAGRWSTVWRILLNQMFSVLRKKLERLRVSLLQSIKACLAEMYILLWKKNEYPCP